MKLEFYKYQGTGNDFVIIDNRKLVFDKSSNKNVAKLCNRRFGIGADGLILLENHPTADFKMVYYNSDGNESSMCGNGGRCISAFAKYLEIVDQEAEFEAIDGMHRVRFKDGIVMLQMQNVSNIQQFKGHTFLDTGSPHHVQIVGELENFDVKSNGAAIRYGKPYNEAGSNVNFVSQISDNEFAVRTYERGVEDETLSCGTGVTAVALAMHKRGMAVSERVLLQTEGGKLEISFKSKNDGSYSDIWLIGPAVQVFKGDVEW